MQLGLAPITLGLSATVYTLYKAKKWYSKLALVMNLAAFSLPATLYRVHKALQKSKQEQSSKTSFRANSPTFRKGLEEGLALTLGPVTLNFSNTIYSLSQSTTRLDKVALIANIALLNLPATAHRIVKVIQKTGLFSSKTSNTGQDLPNEQSSLLGRTV